MNNERTSKKIAKHGQTGFTLIEILLVVVIIGILASAATVYVPKHLETARKNRSKSDIATLGLSVDSYNMDTGKYPGSLNDLVSGDEPYLKDGMIPKDPWGHEYVYAYPGSHRPNKYDIYSLGGDGVQSDDDITSWNRDK